MQMEYDDATMQLNERVRKGLVTPDELSRDTELLDAYVSLLNSGFVYSHEP